MSKIGQIDAYLRTDTGRVRDHNEDFVHAWEPQTPEDEKKHGWVYLVADGVGGADAGEVASEYASERTMAHYLAAVEQPDWGQRLLDAMQSANKDLRQLVIDEYDNSRMATTMVAAVIQDNHAFIGNVGDSRGYLWRSGQLQQITKDQSLVAKLVEEGAITAEEAENHPRKNVILYSLGSENVPKIDLFRLILEAQDILLLCSDGLTKHVPNDELSDIVATNTAADATDILVKLANERGGEDNISVAIIRHQPTGTAVANKNTKKIGQENSTLPVNNSQRLLLWLFTIGLSIAQSFLIFLVWLILRV